MDKNPWQVENLSSFVFLNCPECVFKTKNKNNFQDHALKKHPMSCTLFEKSSTKTEPINMVEAMMDDNNSDFSFPYENDQTLEEIMFSEKQNHGNAASKSDSETTKRSGKVRHNISHIRRDKGPEMVHFCNYCSASFKDILGLKAHIPRHQNALPIAVLGTKSQQASYKPKNLTYEESKSRGYVGRAPIKQQQHDEIYKCHLGDCKFETKSSQHLDLHLRCKIFFRLALLLYYYFMLKLSKKMSVQF